jgi:predicted metal-dependent peptidase
MNPAEIREAAQRISKARAQLILSTPFHATLALRLELRPDERAATIATDGRRLYYNPTWIIAQKPNHLVTIIAHEAMHCSLNHQTRRGARDPERFNIAADHAVNLILNEPVRDPNGAGVLYRFEMPEHATMDKKFAGMAAEAIYPLIPEPAKQRKGGAGKGQPGGGGGSMPDYGGTGCVIDPKGDDGKAMTEAERDELERDWKVATLQAAQAAKAQGKMPGGIEQLIDSIRNPKVDWRAALREFVRQSARNDYSWRRPNVRFLASGDYLPSLWDETTGPIAMGVDTSGSVGDDELAAVCAELNGCLDTARPESVDVVYADAKVQGHERFTPDSYPVKMNAKGRGGTDLRGIWPYLVEHEIDPVCAIVTTDMELRRADLGEEPPFPVLFLSTGRDSPMDGPLPFGTLVKLELDA